MRKVIAFIVLLFIVFSIDGYSCDKKQKSTKKSDIEQTSKKRANSRVSPSSKKTQKDMQKLRIKNHNQKKTNNMWKK
jgi:hypothetical protein